ncbi:hypothetical protein Dcar01_03464 [Deinococcus carri]|uniref:DUF4064 domain-containing protein n=1 Tax=Deinococcus carri TaxID=1211323 RepID=A0ABP9WBK1_9DEIO
MTTPPSVPRPRPPRLAFLTVPLLIDLFYNALSLLTLPFSGEALNRVLAELNTATGQPSISLTSGQLTTVLWTAFFLTAALILLLYFTRRAVLEGRSWGWVASIVIAVFSLLIFPVGTLLGIVMLLGAFDRDVRAYLRR